MYVAGAISDTINKNAYCHHFQASSHEAVDRHLIHKATIDQKDEIIVLSLQLEAAMEGEHQSRLQLRQTHSE